MEPAWQAQPGSTREFMAEEPEGQKPNWLEQLEAKHLARAEAEAEPEESAAPIEHAEDSLDASVIDPPANGPGPYVASRTDSPVDQPPTETPVPISTARLIVSMLSNV